MSKNNNFFLLETQCQIFFSFNQKKNVLLDFNYMLHMDTKDNTLEEKKLKF